MRSTILYIFLIIIAFIPVFGFGQGADTTVTDSTDHSWFHRKKDTDNKTKIFFRFSNNRTVVRNTQIKFTGLRLGVERKNKFRYGILFASLADSVIVLKPENDTIWGSFIDVSAIGGFFEYLLIKNYRWELSIPVDLAFGSTQVQELDHNRKAISEEELPNYFVTQAGLYGQYNINYWFGVGAGFGYRWSISEDKDLQTYLSSPYYIFGVKASIFRGLKSIFRHNKVMDEKIKYFEKHNTEKAEKIKRRKNERINRKSNQKSS